MPYRIKSFGKVQGHDNDIGFSFQENDHGVEQVEDGRSGGAGWAESELIVELQSWLGRRQCRVYVMPHDDALC